MALPESWDGERTHPLVLCMDPQWIHGTACDAAINLGLARLMPRVVVAGLGWDEDTVRAILRRRGEAYTPTEGEFPPQTAPADDGPLVSGRARSHLDFLVTDVLPLIEREYGTDPAERTYVGHSLSGLFGLYTLFTRPETFGRYLLASPSIWWDDRSILSIEAEYAAGHDDLAAQVFMSVGDQEEPPGFFPMITNCRVMAERLCSHQYPGLDLTTVVLPDEIHYSTIPAAVSHGFRTLFGGS